MLIDSRKVCVILFLFACRAEAQAVAPTDTVLDRQTREVASVLRCPVCQGLSIQDSPSDLSQEMKGIVRAQLKAGKSPDEVKAYFVSKYGEWILLEPKAHGMNWLVYLAPFFLLVGGGALIIVKVRKWTTAAHALKMVAEPDAHCQTDDVEVLQ